MSLFVLIHEYNIQCVEKRENFFLFTFIYVLAIFHCLYALVMCVNNFQSLCTQTDAWHFLYVAMSANDKNEN